MPELDVTTVNSPGWWLVRLEKKLEKRCQRYDYLDAYYRGDHTLPEGDERMRDMFRRFQRKARTNYMRLVADSVRERLEITGFRTASEPNTANDKQAWAIWQANHLDADSSIVHGAAGKFADAYVLIGPADDDGDDIDDNPMPVITGEDPRQVIVETDPVNRRVVRAAAKIWRDDVDGKRHAVVYLTERFYYFVDDQADSQNYNGATVDNTGHVVDGMPRPVPPPSTWLPEIVNDEGEPLDDPDDEDADDMPAGSWADNPVAPIIPVVRFLTMPDLTGDGMGEFEDVIDIQDRINNTVLDRLMIAKMQAYRQRWVKGVQTEDEDGNEIPLPFVPGVDLLWAVEDENAQFGDFAQSDLGPLLDAVKADVQAIVSLTGLPPHYVAGDIVNASADALAAAESRLVAKVRDRQKQYGEAWEMVLRIAFRYLGTPEKISVGAEVKWADPERKSIAQVADAVVKKQTAGVPWRQRMEDLGYTPAQIDVMEADRASDAALTAAFAPPVAAPPAPTPHPAPPGPTPAPAPA